MEWAPRGERRSQESSRFLRSLAGIASDCEKKGGEGIPADDGEWRSENTPQCVPLLGCDRVAQKGANELLKPIATRALVLLLFIHLVASRAK